ncbi:PREDICTED: sulfotransferase family cytosolic 1B member 1-like [Crocodylus porosus]|uniref:sulfotransferase family cytosolic 1B member 1-like n=1 Tax=Crocodylus porosus TaxID=8502 RepID=UPI00093BF79C|nr:PREDICTED: sulfotransferase family cytosolic 1B member 1-like [Crocodylus porosus]
MGKSVAYEFWYDHVKGWWEKKQDHPIPYLFYEDMKEDPKCEIRKVMQFLGKDLTEEVLDRIVYHTSFDMMKENPATNYKMAPGFLVEQGYSPFMRKRIGDLKAFLGAEEWSEIPAELRWRDYW